MAKKLDLVAAAKKITPKRRRGTSWLQRLPTDHLEALVDLKSAYDGGELPGFEPKQIYDDLVLANGIKPDCSYITFRAWLGNYHGKKT